MANSILGEGKEKLAEIRDVVVHQNEDIEKISALSAEIERNERALTIRKKQVKEEIEGTLKARRAEILKTFDDEETKLEKQIADENSRRTKVRNGQVSERIDAETEELRREKENLAAEAKKLFKDTKTPAFFNSSFYYALFVPGNFKDIILFILVFALEYFAIPCGIYYFGLGDARKPMYLVVIYVICVALFGGSYMLIHHIADKYRDSIAKGKDIRAKIRDKDKKIKKTTRSIEKDKDDSNYDLESFDSRLSDLSRQKDDIAVSKKAAAETFDKETKNTITEEINERSRQEISELSDALMENKKELADLQVAVQQKTLDIAQDYEVFLGRDNVNPDVLGRMYAIMEEQDLSTIGDALEAYKKESQQNG